MSNQPAPDIDALRNAAVAAWISTFPIDARLEAFLAEVPAALRADVKRSARAIFKAAGDFLEDAAKAGVVKLDTFYPALEAHLRGRFPWMAAPAFSALRSYTGWYAWHEGYSAGSGA
jgi:hypothetical protein